MNHLRATKSRGLWAAFSRWKQGERGFAEVAAAIITIPFMVSLIFVLIETGFNLRYRSFVDSLAQDTLRGVSMDGGTYSSINSLGQSWDSWATAKANLLCSKTGAPIGSSSSRCTQAPSVVCTPVGNPLVALGSEAKCTFTFYYKPVIGLMQNDVFSLGFSGMFKQPISITITSRVLVGT